MSAGLSRVAAFRWRASFMVGMVVLATALAATPAAGSGEHREATRHASRSAALTISDQLGDGRPDIVRMTVEHSRIAMAVVTVRVRDVTRPGDTLRLYVDPSGTRSRPSYAIILGLLDPSNYGVVYTEGWRLRPRQRFTCGERVRLFMPGAGVREVKFQMPGACFGDSGARFAAQVHRGLTSSDWTPRRQTLSKTFVF